MKKLLLLAAGMMLASSAAMAEETTVTPTVYPGYVLTTISPNGEWTVSVNPYLKGMTIVNVNTGETWSYGGDASDMEEYDGGMKHFVSNNGIVIGSFNEALGIYWEDGEWNYLPSKPEDLTVYPKSISSDGNVIAGNVARMEITLEDTDEPMSIPVVWTRNASGEYDDYVELPYPNVDWTGRMPQFVLINDISADGKLCGGCVVDYSGQTIEPIIFTQKDNGEWEYTLVHPELLNPDNVEFPAYPGEAPDFPDPKNWMSPENADRYDEAISEYYNRPYPQMYEFMTEDELAAYYEAFENYEADPENNPYPYMNDFIGEEGYNAYIEAVNQYYTVPMPDPTDFMSADELANYETAQEAYQIAYDEWRVKYIAFSEALMTVWDNFDVPAFVMNSAAVSPNGKYLASTAEILFEDPMSWTGTGSVIHPFLFDLETNEYVMMDKGMDDVIAEQVSDNGWVLGATPYDSTTRQTVLAKGPESGFQQLITLVQEQDTDLYNWMVENMTHYVEEVDYVYNEETEDYDTVINVKEEFAEGTTFASDDFSVFAGFVANNWDYMDENQYYSYIYGISGGITGVMTVSSNARDFSIYAQRGGIINIAGGVANIAVYDITGRKVFSADAPASQVSTGLSNGTYVVTAKAANGQMVTKKVVF